MKAFLSFLCILALLPQLLFAGVTGEGRAEIFNNNENSARKQAIQNALRDAVEKGVGLILDSKTQVENWQVIKDEVYSSAQGFVKEYKTTRSERVGNTWFVEIEAEVAEGDIKDKLTQLRLLHKKMGNKRLMVIYRPEQDQAQAPDHASSLAALRGLETKLNERGFRLFDQKMTMSLYQTGQDREAWLKIAQEHQVDMLIEYEVLATGRHQSGQMFQSAKSQVIARVYDVSTGRLISHQSGTQKQMTNARVGSFDWTNALSKAGEKAAMSVADEITKEVIAYYEGIGDRGHAYFIRFEGFNEDEEDTLLGLLEKMDGFQSLSELSNTPDLIEVEYFSGMGKSRLRRKIRLDAKSKGIRLKSAEISGNRMHFVRP